MCRVQDDPQKTSVEIREQEVYKEVRILACSTSVLRPTPVLRRIRRRLIFRTSGLRTVVYRGRRFSCTEKKNSGKSQKYMALQGLRRPPTASPF